MATFSVHFDGPITIDHRVPVRVLARTYDLMQGAIDRAYLINRYGSVYKHARLKYNQYPDTEFIAAYPREGGIFLDVFKEHAGPIIDRIATAVQPFFDQAMQQGAQQFEDLSTQYDERKNYVQQVGENTRTFQQVAAEPPPNWAANYSNRSVIKEVDQLVHQVTPDRVAGSTVEITLLGDQAHLPMRFDARIANRFHAISAHRELGAAIIMEAVIRSLDRGNKHTMPSAKVQNSQTGREVTLRCLRREDADLLHPFHTGNPVRLYVSPLIEAQGFDLNGGDMVFLGVV